MTLQLSGAISFTDIQTIFGGTNPIGMNEYYTNDASGFTTGVDGLPSTGSAISLQQFYGKSKGSNGLYSFTSHTFTNAGATGFSGPILSQVRSAYSATSWAQNSTYLNMTTQGIQLWTVPATGSYNFKVVGAHGAASNSGTAGTRGGLGAIVIGTINLTKNNVIRIIVGQGGSYGVSYGGGGGASVIYNTTTGELLFIAGGGGGRAGGTTANTNSNGINASLYNYGHTASTASTTSTLIYMNTAKTYNGKVATLGYGGIEGEPSGYGDSGAGWLGDGATDSIPSTVATSLSGTALGGGSGQEGSGGFGGGGCGMGYIGGVGGGGGGGYTGGNGGRLGGGGGSYVNSSVTNPSMVIDDTRSYIKGGTPIHGYVDIIANFTYSVISLYDFISHTFTNAGAYGAFGPILSQVRSAYSTAYWAQYDSYLSMSKQGIQLWTVPATGSYTIEMAGGAGGFICTNGTARPGYGYKISANITLIKGSVLNIVVGQRGVGWPSGNGLVASLDQGGGGGGASCVFEGTTLYMIAAGGNGQSWDFHTVPDPDGQGTGATNALTSQGRGYRGATFNTDGDGGIYAALAIINGAKGGNFSVGYGNTGVYTTTNHGQQLAGGFGGGGGTFPYEGGGGGGYQGGIPKAYNSYTSTYPLQGATSYIAGTLTAATNLGTNTSGTVSDYTSLQGYVKITKVL